MVVLADAAELGTHFLYNSPSDVEAFAASVVSGRPSASGEAAALWKYRVSEVEAPLGGRIDAVLDFFIAGTWVSAISRKVSKESRGTF